MNFRLLPAPAKSRENGQDACQVTVDYLVGGLRISVGPNSTTPGPRSHILNFVRALKSLGGEVRLVILSETPGLTRFAKISEGSGQGSGALKLLVSDIIRILVAIYFGARTFIGSSFRDSPSIIYERVSVMQSSTSFHRWKKKAVRIVETNGLMWKETSIDRSALLLTRLAAAIERRVYRRADIIVAVSAALAREVAQFSGVPEDKILVVPNAIPFEITEGNPWTPPVNEQIVIGFAGAVVKWQQLDVLIGAVARHNRQTAHTVHVEIVGDGPELSGLKKLVADKRLGDVVTFTGRRSPDDVYESMRTWTVGFAGHARTVGQNMYHSPLKLYEYAGCGLGVISTGSEDADRLQLDGLPVWFFESGADLDEAIMQIASGSALLTEFRRNGTDGLFELHSWISRARAVLTAASRITEKS